MTQLILFRGLQGLGAGFMQILAFILVADLFPPAERARWQGVFVGVVSLALIVGPAVGGTITDHATWRWVFYVNLPIGFLALLALAVWLPATLSRRSSAHRGWAAVRHIDFAGVLTAAAATACLLLVLTWGGTRYPGGQVKSLAYSASPQSSIWRSSSSSALCESLCCRLISSASGCLLPADS